MQHPPGAFASECAITRGAGAKRLQAIHGCTSQAGELCSSDGGAGLAANPGAAQHLTTNVLVKAKGMETVLPVAAAEHSSMSNAMTGQSEAQSSCMAADMIAVPSAATGPGSLHHHVTAAQRQKYLRPLCSLNEELLPAPSFVENQLDQQASALKLCPSAMFYMDLNEMSPLNKNRQGLRTSISSLRLSMVRGMALGRG
jgi:hypothetical protein